MILQCNENNGVSHILLFMNSSFLAKPQVAVGKVIFISGLKDEGFVSLAT